MKTKSSLLLLRMFLGITFGLAVWPKIAAGLAYPGILRAFLENFAASNAQPFYQSFLANVVLPHIGVFSVLVVVAEACVTLALVSGTLTRLAGVVAMILLTNCMLAKGMWWWYPASNDAADFVIALALIVGAAARTFGIDAALAARWPRSLLW